MINIITMLLLKAGKVIVRLFLKIFYKNRIKSLNMNSIFYMQNINFDELFNTIYKNYIKKYNKDGLLGVRELKINLIRDINAISPSDFVKHRADY
jgi:hypothetical protein